AKGFASGSERELLADFGLLDAEEQAPLREHAIERWRAYFAEVKKREAETVARIRKGEVELEGTVKGLDGAIVGGLDGEDGDFSLRLRKLSATVINSLIQEDLRFGVSTLLAGNVVLARFIDEGGFERESDPMFRAAALNEGLINAVKDADGVLRSVPLARGSGKAEWQFTLSLACVLSAYDIPAEDLAIGTGAHAGKFSLPDDMTLRINYVGGPGSIHYIPLYRFLESEIDPASRTALERQGITILGPVGNQELEGRILLVGDTTRNGQDFVSTPVTRLYKTATGGEVELRAVGATLREMPGVEVHANAIFNILNDTWLRPLSRGITLLLFACLGGLCLLFYWHRTGFLLGGAILILLVSGTFAVAYGAFLTSYTLFPLVPALAVIGFNFVGGVAYQGILQQMKKKAVTSMFGKYVSDNLVQKLVSGELEVDLEGKMKNLTVLFSDIRGFTRLSEGLDPETVSRILRAYFSRMIRTIFEHGGTLDKLMGDAIMAFFGDPEDMPVHPKRAADAALAMLESLEDLKRSSEIPAMKDLNIGIGLNTGLVTVGNLGSDEYFDYTVIGDHVNLGSRLEGLNKAYDTNVIVSEFAHHFLTADFEFRRLGRVTVMGRTKPVEIFELLGRKNGVPPEKLERKAAFEEGLELWEKGEFSGAAGKLQELLNRGPDGPATVFLQLAKQYEAEGPPPDWDGVFVPKGK
ncbi:MAG: adenylate/guanylate cyclase domain-containing protein, partial [Planctomycetota bacterium]